jgi:hypothetical protein
MGRGTTSADSDARSMVTLYAELNTASTTTTTASTMVTAAAVPAAPAERPWGAPHAGLHEKASQRREDIVRVAFEGVGKLLEPLQAAHRQGDLTPADVEELHRLQVWYGRLQAELECLRINDREG